jgi:hypothetical protein
VALEVPGSRIRGEAGRKMPSGVTSAEPSGVPNAPTREGAAGYTGTRNDAGPVDNNRRARVEKILGKIR